VYSRNVDSFGLATRNYQHVSSQAMIMSCAPNHRNRPTYGVAVCPGQ